MEWQHVGLTKPIGVRVDYKERRRMEGYNGNLPPKGGKLPSCPWEKHSLKIVISLFLFAIFSLSNSIMLPETD